MVADRLAEPDVLADWLKVPPDDYRLLAALDAASTRFRGAVRHHVTAVIGDEIVVDADGTAVLMLPGAPVRAVSEVAVHGDVLAPDRYRWSADGLIERTTGRWPKGYRSVRVVYDHGHDVVPADVAEAVIDQARQIYAVSPGVSSTQVGGMTTAYLGSVRSGTVAGVSATWTQAVENHRLRRGDAA